MTDRPALSPSEVSYRHQVLSQFDCYTGAEVRAILARNSGDSSVVDRLRENGEVIGLRLDRGYAYPAFQFDRQQGVVRNVVRYANQTVNASLDPFGAAEWWSTTSRVLRGQTPLHALHAGGLTVDAVDLVRKYELD